MKLLSDLLGRSLGISAQLVAGSLSQPVRDVVFDSRRVQAGDAFVCLPGYASPGGETRADCHQFIPDAVARGVGVLVVDRPIEVPPQVTVVRVGDCWSALAAMACANFDQPSQALTMVGVTGTSGKTSTTYFIEAVLRRGGLRSARFGTIDYRFDDEVLTATHTTPEAPDLQRLLRRAVDQGFAAVVMEVSSHALELRRVAGVEFDVGVFTNITQDHLNFHPDMQHYLQAKARLFEGLGSGGKVGTAVVNLDDPAAAHMIAVNRGRLLTYGMDLRADVRGHDVQSGLHGTRFTAHSPLGELAIAFPHLGEFHVHNALAAIATGIALGLSADVIVAGLAVAPPVPGRFELVDCGQDFLVAVDYAHKPDALERLLRSARNLQPRRLIVVFGCGGDRDRQKRPLMGRIAAQASNVVIVTSDNPRSEPPRRIIAEILEGTRVGQGNGCRVLDEPDRAAAIALAIDEAQSGDVVLIAGKGHETYQQFADHQTVFDDREVARVALLRRLQERR